MKNHRTLATFLLGTSLAVGAVVGLAPSSQAKGIDPTSPVVSGKSSICQKIPELCKGPVVVNPTLPPITVQPTTTVKPTTTVQPTTTVKQTTTTKATTPKEDPKPSTPSANPDAPVKGQPVFTG